MAQHRSTRSSASSRYHDPLDPALRLALAHALRTGDASGPWKQKVQAYQASMWGVLRTRERSPAPQFLVAYASLVENPKLPFFTMPQMMDIHLQWKRDPAIIDDLLFLGECLARKCPPLAWWEAMLREGFALKSYERKAYWYHLSTLLPATGLLEKYEALFIRFVQVVCRSGILKRDVPSKADLRDPRRRIGRLLSYHRELGRSLFRTKPFPDPEVVALFLEWDGKDLVDGAIDRAFFDRVTTICGPAVGVRLFAARSDRTLYKLWVQYPDFFDVDPHSVRTEHLTQDRSVGYSVMHQLAGTRLLPEPFVLLFAHLNDAEVAWMAHMLRGGSIRRAPDLPFALSRGTAHVFERVCSEHRAHEFLRGARNVGSYLIYAELIACGATAEFAGRATGLVDLYDNAAEWIGYCRLLITMGMEPQHLQQVADYLRWRARNGQIVDIRGMTAQGLLRRFTEWHRELEMADLAREIVHMQTPFPDMGLKPYGQVYDGAEYRITQIRMVAELMQEGKVMRHCVFSYSQDCISGRTAIFSLHKKTGENIQPLITIQVMHNAVVQAKGFGNRKATDMELRIIRNWIKENPEQLKGGMRRYL